MKKFWSVIGISSGLLSAIASIVVWTQSVGSYEQSEMYGGDAYTGIQNAAAQTANNVQELAALVRSALAFGLLVVGIALICYFAIKLCEACEESKAIKKELVETLMQENENLEYSEEITEQAEEVADEKNN